MKFQVALYESPRGSMVADHTAFITRLQWATDTGGDKDLTYTATLNVRDAMALFDRQDILHVQVSRGGEILWQGRVTQSGIIVSDETSVEIQALGYRTALYDTLYTAMWRTTDVSQFFPVIGPVAGVYRADRYAPFLGDGVVGISMLPQTYTNLMYGLMSYEIPSQSSRYITTMQMRLAYNIPKNTRLVVQRSISVNVTPYTDIISITGPATSTSNVVSATFSVATSVGMIAFGIIPTGAPVTPATTDDFYVRASEVIISTRTASSNTIANGKYSEVIEDLVASVNSQNPNEIVAATGMITDVAGSWETVLFQDLRPGEILDKIVTFGNGTTLLEWGIDQQRVLYMRPVTQLGNIYQVELDRINMQRSNVTLYNQAYGKTTNSNGVIIRDPLDTDEQSVLLIGLRRTTFVDAGQFTDSAIGSASFANSRLNYLSTPTPEITVNPALIILLGAIVEPYRVRAGDAIEIISAPFIRTDALNRSRLFRVIETRYDAISDQIVLTPEKAPARLEDVLRR